MIYNVNPLSGELATVSIIKIPIGIERNLALEALLTGVNSRLTGKRIEQAGIEEG